MSDVVGHAYDTLLGHIVGKIISYVAERRYSYHQGGRAVDREGNHEIMDIESVVPGPEPTVSKSLVKDHIVLHHTEIRHKRTRIYGTYGRRIGNVYESPVPVRNTDTSHTPVICGTLLGYVSYAEHRIRGICTVCSACLRVN